MMRLLAIILALIYTLSPVDLIPDFIAILGWLDDLILWGILCWYLWFRIRSQAVQEGERSYTDDGQHSHYGNGADAETDEELGDPPSGTEKDPYRILGVERGASEEEIRRAYRQQANRYHPDKVAHLGEEFQDMAETRFKEIQEAYRTLMPK